MLNHSKLSHLGYIGVTMLLIAFTTTIAFALPSFIHASTVINGVSVEPERVAVAPNGTVYLSEPQNNRILIISSQGTRVGEIQIAAPLAIGLLSNGNLLVGHGTQVDCFTTAGLFVSSLGSGTGEYGKPNDLTIATDGTVYVTDSKFHIVKVYHTNGSYWFTIGSRGTGNGQFQFPTGICLNAVQDELFVADQGNCRVQVFSRSGSYLRQFGRLTYQQGTTWVFDGTFTRVQSIATDQYGRVYVSDLYQNDVQVLSSTGAFLGRITPTTTSPFAQPADIAVNGNRLVVLSSLSSQVFTYEIDELTAVNEPASIVYQFALDKNYPNPFNSVTRIPFTLKSSGRVSLTVWNVLGEKVATVVNSRLSTGRHEALWNTNSVQSGGVTSGVYYCKLSVADDAGANLYQSTVKLLYLK